MNRLATAILHLRSPAAHLADALHHALGAVPGVRHVTLDLREALVAVQFDAELTGVADLVRSAEDAGSIVSGVAQRPSEPPVSTAL